MILAYLGAPRTGTTSLFTALSNHVNIAPSKVKELLNEMSFDRESYLDQFEVTEDTKILLDGTPCAYHYFHHILKMNYLKLIDHSIKIIYPIRDPYDRMYSTILQTILSKIKGYKKRTYPSYINSRYEVDEDKIMEHIPIMLDSENLKYARNLTDDILIIDFNKTDFKQIFEFLGIESIDVELPHLNTIEKLAGEKILNSDEFKKLKDQLNNLFYNNKELDQLIEEDRRKIEKIFDMSYN